MDYTLDVVVIIILIVFTASGYKQGFLKSIASVMGSLISSLMSAVLSKPIAEAIYNSTFKSAVVSKIDSAMKATGEDFLNKFLDSMPDFIGSSLQGFNISTANLTAASAQGAAQLERVIAPIFISFISIITTILLFVVLLIISRFVSRFMGDSLDDTPLGSVDSFMGGIIGMMEGFVIITLCAFILRISLPHMNKAPNFLSDTSISQTIVFKGIYDSPIVTGLVSAVTDSPNTAEVSK